MEQFGRISEKRVAQRAASRGRGLHGLEEVQRGGLILREGVVRQQAADLPVSDY